MLLRVLSSVAHPMISYKHLSSAIAIVRRVRVPVAHLLPTNSAYAALSAQWTATTDLATATEHLRRFGARSRALLGTAATEGPSIAIWQ